MMDEQVEPAYGVPDGESNGAPALSLEQRMAVARERIESQQTEKFPLPNSDGSVAVELRVLGFHTEHRLARRNQRMRNEADRDLSTVADELVEATVGFHMLVNDEWVPQPSTTWASIARAIAAHVGRPLAESLTPRLAIIEALGDNGTGVIMLSKVYTEWVLEGRSAAAKELDADFATTH